MSEHRRNDHAQALKRTHRPQGCRLMCRLLALLLCLSACMGIGLELCVLMKGGLSILGALWVLIGYFTIWTNGLVAAVFAAVALYGERFDHPRLMAGLVASMALVGVIFAFLLQGLRTMNSATAEANFLLHQLNPMVIVVFWLLFTRKGMLSWRDPFLWALYPLGYLGYALIRGQAERHYAYPFIDVSTNGWIQVMTNAVAIALCFVAAAEGMVLIDWVLAQKSKRHEQSLRLTERCPDRSVGTMRAISLNVLNLSKSGRVVKQIEEARSRSFIRR